MKAKRRQNMNISTDSNQRKLNLNSEAIHDAR